MLLLPLVLRRPASLSRRKVKCPHRAVRRAAYPFFKKFARRISRDSRLGPRVAEETADADVSPDVVPYAALREQI